MLQVFAAPSTRVAKPDTWTDDRNHFYVFFDNDGEVVAGSKPESLLAIAERLVVAGQNQGDNEGDALLSPAIMG